MESFTYPECHLTVHIALYTTVSNGAALRQRIVAAATATGIEGESERSAVNFAFINARLVGDQQNYVRCYMLNGVFLFQD